MSIVIICKSVTFVVKIFLKNSSLISLSPLTYNEFVCMTDDGDVKRDGELLKCLGKGNRVLLKGDVGEKDEEPVGIIGERMSFNFNIFSTNERKKENNYLLIAFLKDDHPFLKVSA